MLHFHLSKKPSLLVIYVCTLLRFHLCGWSCVTSMQLYVCIYGLQVILVAFSLGTSYIVNFYFLILCCQVCDHMGSKIGCLLPCAERKGRMLSRSRAYCGGTCIVGTISAPELFLQGPFLGCRDTFLGRAFPSLVFIPSCSQELSCVMEFCAFWVFFEPWTLGLGGAAGLQQQLEYGSGLGSVQRDLLATKNSIGKLL